MELRVLGPLEIEIDGRLLRLGPQQRAVLLALLTAGGKVVPSARLAELIWGPEPGDSAASTLRSHIHHLRRTLRSSGSAALTLGTASGGYWLNVAPDMLDSVRFAYLATEARSALEADDPDSALATVDAALAMWRGPAFADVADRPFAAAEIARLEGARRAAEHTRIEALLATGRHSEVADEVGGMIAERPDDEVLRQVLALALYRGDRQGKALEVCREGLAVAREQGLDSPRLQQLQQDILRRSPALDWVPVSHGPGLLPPAVGDFVGRSEELDLLRSRAAEASIGPRGAPVLTAIVGKAGIGKTALALRMAHELARQFPGGQLFLDLRGQQADERIETGAALDRMLRLLGVPYPELPTTIDSQLIRYRTLLTDKRVLIVLDDASSSDQVRPLLPPSHTCMVLVTSRDLLGELVVKDGAHPVHLDLLSDSEAVELLGRLAGTERVDAEPAAAAQIARLCGYLPLAVRIAGANIAVDRKVSLSKHAARLGDQRHRLGRLAVGEVEFRASIATSYQAMPAPAQRVFGLLSLIPGPDFADDSVAALAGIPVGDALDRLVDAHLVEPPSPSGRYHLHDLVRLYARECGGAMPDRSDATARLLDWYVDSANAAEQVLSTGQKLRETRPPRFRVAFEDVADALDWFEAERSNLIAAVHWAREQRQYRFSWMLADATWYFFRLRRYSQDWLDTHGIGLAAARADGDRQAEALMLSGIGTALWELKQHRAAIDHHRESLALFAEVGDRRHEALALNRLAIAFGELGQYEETLSHLRQSLDIAIEVGDVYGQAVALGNIGETHQRLGRFDDALDFLHQALEVQQRTGDRYSTALTLDCIGEVYVGQGRLDLASSTLERALAMYREIRHTPGEGRVLLHLGRVAEMRGDEIVAEDYRRQAAERSAELGADVRRMP